MFQHTEKQPCVHFADAHVVGEGVEVGHAVGGVLHGRFNPNRLDAAPVQADEDFRVEIHAVAHGFFADDRKRGGERVQAEAAHAVFDVARPSVQHVPEIGNFAPVQPRFGRVVSVLRPAADDGFGVLFRRRQEFGRVVQMVLPVGIDL